MKELLQWLNDNGTKVIGYTTIALGFIATADKELVTGLLGESFPRWALLLTGLLTALRGHQNTARITKETEE